MDLLLVRVNTKLRGLQLGGEYVVHRTVYVDAAINAKHLTVLDGPEVPQDATEPVEAPETPIEPSEESTEPYSAS